MSMHPPADKALRKYLADHAEREAAFARVLESRSLRFAHALVIPVYGEGLELIRCLETIPAGSEGRVLTVLVINAPADAPDWVHAANLETLRALSREYPGREELAPGLALHSEQNRDLLVIDRATRGRFLPAGQGVGLARKLGADLALAAKMSGVLDSAWIHCSDADVEFPGDYFRQTEAPGRDDAAARLYRFRHRPIEDDAAYEAAQQYEISLRYYVLGLGFAGSPYAFHSIGSTFAIEAESYAKVRGFPRRTAAEDFYLLNKLAKVGRVESLRGDPVRPSSRLSSRVPFGTGAAVARMLEDRESERKTYHPALFRYLRAWLDALEAVLAHSGSTRTREALLDDALRECCARAPGVEAERLLLCLERTGALASARRALCAPARAVRGRVQDGFDGFRTLKLLHALRDSGLEDLALREALGRADFLPLSGELAGMPTRELAARVEALEVSAGERTAPVQEPAR